MRLQVKASNLSLSPEIEGYIHKKVQGLERLVPSGDTSAVLSVEVAKTTEHHRAGDIFRAEFDLHIAGKHIRADAEASDIFSALDIAKDEALQALRSHKDKRETRFRRFARRMKDVLRWRPF